MNYSIQNHSFDEEKEKLKALLKNETEEISIKKLEPSRGWFKFSRSVKQEELNESLIEIQNILQEHKNIFLECQNAFSQVYNIFEALDKEYVNGFLISFKSTEEVSKKVLKAQEDINKTIKKLNRTVKLLISFKKSIDSHTHIKDIDLLWKEVECNKKDIAMLYQILNDSYRAELQKLKRQTKINNVIIYSVIGINILLTGTYFLTHLFKVF